MMISAYEMTPRGISTLSAAQHENSEAHLLNYCALGTSTLHEYLVNTPTPLHPREKYDILYSATYLSFNFC